MIKVINIITGLYQGGAEMQLLYNMKNIDTKKYKCYVVSLCDEGNVGKKIIQAGIPVYSLDIKKSKYAIIRFLMFIRALFILSRYIKEVKPDIVQTWLHHADLAGLIACKLAGHKKLFWSVHCSYLRPPYFKKRNIILVKLLGKLSKIPKVISFNSSAGLKSHIEMGYIPKQMKMIPCGFDSKIFSPNSKKRQNIRDYYGISDSDFLVGFVGRHHVVKDIKTFLLAVHELSKKHNNIQTIMVGQGFDEFNQEIISLKKDLQLKNIKLLGRRDDVPALMNAFDLFLITSVSEGFPNVLGEAMLTGLPCLVTDVGDCKEVLANNKYVFNVGDYKGMANKASEIINLTELQKKELSLYNQKIIKKNYEISIVTKKYQEIYKTLIQKT